MHSEQITQLLILLIIFGSAAVAVRAIADAIVRLRALREGVDADTVEATQLAERATMRLRALRLGLLATGLAASLLSIAALGLAPNSASAIGALLLGVGASQLAFFAMTRPAQP